MTAGHVYVLFLGKHKRIASLEAVSDNMTLYRFDCGSDAGSFYFNPFSELCTHWEITYKYTL